MFLGKNNENIYGYTGKRTPSYNFASSSLQSSYKKTMDVKKPVVTKDEKQKELLVKSIVFSQTYEPNSELVLFYEKDSDIINISTTEPVDVLTLIHQNIHCKIGENVMFEFSLLPHEKGVSIKSNSFLVHPVSKIQDETLSLCFSVSNGKIKVVETKFSFKNPEFPFYYKYEKNPNYDDIFNDFIESNLPQIKPPSNITVPSKHTQSNISYRQFISYIKTSSLMNFKVDSSGWYIDSFTEAEDKNECPSGIIFRPLPSWTWHPGGQRIEHTLQFQ